MDFLSLYKATVTTNLQMKGMIEKKNSRLQNIPYFKLCTHASSRVRGERYSCNVSMSESSEKGKSLSG